MSIELDWHGMLCPNCKTAENLRVFVTTAVALTHDGTEDRGDAEWDEDSHCLCLGCDLEGPTRIFDFSGEKPAVKFSRDAEITWELQVYGMVCDESGDAVLADSVGAWPVLWDIHVKRVCHETGEVWVIEELEDLDRVQVDEMVPKLEEKYATLGVFAEWV